MTKANIRQVRYNVKTKPGEALPYTWTFVLINEPTEIERIKQRTLTELAKKGDFTLGVEARDLIQRTEPIKKSGGLHYSAHEVLSQRGDLTLDEWKKIYSAPEKIHRDRKLGEPRPDIEVWLAQTYIPSITQRR